jgi:hypothetical protein
MTTFPNTPCLQKGAIVGSAEEEIKVDIVIDVMEQETRLTTKGAIA